MARPSITATVIRVERFEPQHQLVQRMELGRTASRTDGGCRSLRALLGDAGELADFVVRDEHGRRRAAHDQHARTCAVLLELGELVVHREHHRSGQRVPRRVGKAQRGDRTVTHELDRTLGHHRLQRALA